MPLKKNSILLLKIDEGDILLLEKEAAKRKSVLPVIIKMLEQATRETHVSLDDPNWTIRRARKDGQESLVNDLKRCFGE